MHTEYSIEVTPPEPGQGAVHRSILSPNELMKTPAKDVNTLTDILQYAAKTYKTRKAFGYRKLLNTIVEEKDLVKVVDGVEKKVKKSWTFFELSAYEYYDYQEAVEMTKTIGAGLVKLGATKGDRLQIVASTRLVVEKAIWPFFLL
jgi:long-chain acyl-CoA synthetase